MRDSTVLAYFGDDPSRVYQLAQWLPVLELLDGVQPVGIVLRREDTAALVRSTTELPVLVAEEFGALRELYADLDAKVALYVNNSPHNFHSLLEPRMLHAHVNHGESDKQSMASNNAKAYDRVYVAGEAAVQRLTSALLEFDTGKLVRIGRPQLDLRRAPVLPPSSRRTVLYAPTFEGDAEYNNYSSLDRLGVAIVRQLLSVPDVRVVYKPHPRVLSSTHPGVRAAHEEIQRLLTGEHVALAAADILAVMPDCDAMVTDVSSVGLDWLYLRTEAPLFIADRYDDPERLRLDAPVSRCADVVGSEALADLGRLVAQRLEHDELRLARSMMRRHYFGDLKVGESTARFIDAVRELAAHRDALLAAQVAEDPLAGEPAG
ncbi:CDP-glycerol--glycerophosphate glycerophosphotransferase [Nocardioides anomalus]|uniref:CDP-glycerol--glycerophosphate glycerophosphotransferase n=1 Tax=Nocardioides anomalus TaxID=2712223 RepID=A0A6G6WH94_9ACTN|nr:CDP-glycerol glycerophosphotransferase family protein [Nocardioides anomalus]QIG44430.1 CDP-glycerol--glycerophosphate glycerophosphotransferase [Nocardioides anomalus]